MPHRAGRPPLACRDGPDVQIIDETARAGDGDGEEGEGGNARKCFRGTAAAGAAGERL